MDADKKLLGIWTFPRTFRLFCPKRTRSPIGTTFLISRRDCSYRKRLVELSQRETTLTERDCSHREKLLSQGKTASQRENLLFQFWRHGELCKRGVHKGAPRFRPKSLGPNVRVCFKRPKVQTQTPWPFKRLKVQTQTPWSSKLRLCFLALHGSDPNALVLLAAQGSDLNALEDQGEAMS